MARSITNPRKHYLNRISRNQIRAADRRFLAAVRDLTSALRKSDRV